MKICPIWDEIVYCAARAASELFRSILKFPSRTSHAYYFLSRLCVFTDHGKGITGIYATTRLFAENNIS